MGGFSYICPVCGNNIRGGTAQNAEVCRLIHIRNGKRVGSVVGHYNNKGSVHESVTYRGAEILSDGTDNINSRKQVRISEKRLNDSFMFGRRRELPCGNIIDISDFHIQRIDYLGETEIYVLMSLVENGYILSRSTPEHVDVVKQLVEISRLAIDLTKELSEGRLNNIGIAENAKLQYINGYRLADLMNLKQEEWKEIKSIVYHWINQLPVYYGKSGVIAVHDSCYQSLSPQELRNIKFSFPDPEEGAGEPRKQYM